MNSLPDTGDEALAELALLEQNQKKLQSLTTRMTTILHGFDRRLAGLDHTLLPIHHRTQTLQRVEKNVDSTLEALKHTLGNFDIIAEEEANIARGPDVQNINAYFDTIDRVVRGLKHLKRTELQSQEQVMMRMYELVEVGSRNLTALMQDWVTAESSPVNPQEGQPLPILSGTTLESIIPILSHLKALPSNPANGYAPFLAALSLYSDTRGGYLEASVAPIGQQLVNFVVTSSSSNTFAIGDDEAQYQRGSAGIRHWVNIILDLAENDHAILSNLLRGLNPPSSNNTIASTFSRLLRPILRHFVSTMGALQGHIRRGVDHYALLAFDLIGSLSDLSLRWDSVIANAAGKSDRDEEGGAHALREQVQALHKTMMNVFPNILNTISNLPQQRQDVPSTGVNEISWLSISIVRQLCDYADVVASLLTTLGAGNWMMSGNAAPVLSLSINAEDHNGILAQYLCDVLATTITALEARSKAIKQASTASIFQLNNIGHLQRELSSTSHLSSYLGNTGNEVLQAGLRQARTGYLDAWHPVVSALMDEGTGLTTKSAASKLGAGVLGGGDRAQKEDAKQRFARFFEGLDDLERLHTAYPLSREDGELRENLKREVLRLVMPLYSKFVAKQMAAHFSSNPAKHLRPEAEVEERLNRMFT